MKSDFTYAFMHDDGPYSFPNRHHWHKNEPPAYDTIRIGGMIIVRKAGSKDKEVTKDGEYKMKNRRGNKPLQSHYQLVDL